MVASRRLRAHVLSAHVLRLVLLMSCAELSAGFALIRLTPSGPSLQPSPPFTPLGDARDLTPAPPPESAGFADELSEYIYSGPRADDDTSMLHHLAMHQHGPEHECDGSGLWRGSSPSTSEVEEEPSWMWTHPDYHEYDG